MYQKYIYNMYKKERNLGSPDSKIQWTLPSLMLHLCTNFRFGVILLKDKQPDRQNQSQYFLIHVITVIKYYEVN